MSETQHADKTSAEDKSIGFDYQYYYFLSELLNLKKGQVLGLEVMDDVHSELNDNTKILVQLKHTIQTKADGSPKNLTTMDGDFWKSLSNWCKVITDEHAGRKEIAEQKAFVNQTTFLLASNKSDNENNMVLAGVRRYQKDASTYSSLIEEIEGLKKKSEKSKTKEPKIVSYIKEVLNLSEDISKSFFQKLEFDLGCDDLIAKCKTSIAEHFIASDRVDEVFNSLDSQLRSDNFDLVKNKQKICISFEDFQKKYQIHFDRARNKLLKIHQFNVLPDNINDQTFLRQLIDIGDVQANDIEEISRLSYHHLLATNNIERWIHEGDITSLDVDSLEEDATTHWRNLFRKAFRNEVPESAINASAQKIVDALRMEKLSIAAQELGFSFSNGEFYSLCEQLKIGWRKDWETKYK